MTKKRTNRYSAIIERVFFDKYREGIEEFEFLRQDLVQAAKDVDVQLPKNLGDVIYSIRYRTDLPQSIMNTQP